MAVAVKPKRMVREARARRALGRTFTQAYKVVKTPAASAGVVHVAKAPTGGVQRVPGPISGAPLQPDAANRVDWAAMDCVPTDRGTADWAARIKTMVSSFKVATEEPDSATTVGVRFVVDLLGADAGLDDVTRLVRDELKTVEVPDRWTKLMELHVDAAQPEKVLFWLASEPPTEMQDGTYARQASGTGWHGDPPEPASNTVELKTETGTITYALPLSLDRDTIGSVDVSEILSAAGKPNRALANTKRKANQLLGLKVGNQYLYPTFQFDRERKRIRPMALYANTALECDLDPWGTLDWWFAEHRLLDEESPVDRLEAGTLIERDIDRMIAHDRMGMD